MFHSNPALSKSIFTVLLIFTVLFSWTVRLAGIGWYLFIFGIPMLLMTIAHIVIHLRAITKIPYGNPRVLALSNLYFFLFLALQFDAGDSSDVGIALFYFIRNFGVNLEWLNYFQFHGNSYLSYLAAILLFVSWFALRANVRVKLEENI